MDSIHILIEKEVKRATEKCSDYRWSRDGL
jgi:hypothetical protein